MGGGSREQALLKARGVEKAFDGRPVLRGIDLDVKRGESVALLGSNGCGKSTFLKCCNRLVAPDRGKIIVDGIDMGGVGRSELRRLRAGIGFVFQRHNLVGRLCALTNVIHGRLGRNSGPGSWYQSLASRRVREEAMACLEEVGMAHLASSRASCLSGGESQRVAVARALMQEPVLLLADEPVASLDPRVGHEVMGLFRQLVRARGIGLLFVSHDLDHALEYSDRIVAIQEGRVVLDRPAGKVKKHELKEIYE